MSIEITRRSAWGAKGGTGSLDPGAERNVVIHNSYRPALSENATDAQEVAAWKSVEKYHVETHGWDGIGYNFGVAPSGRIYEGRGWQYRGAHAGPANADSIGICLLIDGQVTTPGTAMIEAVRGLIRVGLELGEIDKGYKVTGHRDWMKRTCPGDKVYAVLSRFRHDADAPFAIPPGTRVWSNQLNEHVVVTNYRHDGDWSYLTETQLEALGFKAGEEFSRMPKARW